MVKAREQHGLTTQPDTHKCYHVWHDIKTRCFKVDHKEYPRYGGRGITLQESWVNDPTSFCAYVLSLEGFCLSKSLDRVDNRRGYEVGNLRWASDAEQVRNRSKNQNNTSGKCGVTWYYNKTGGTRSVAWWYENGKAKSKSFSTKKFGLLPAFTKACKYREQMIEKLNSQGAGYTDEHGR